VIASETEYENAREELDHLARWLNRLETVEVAERKVLTITSVRRMISRVQEELAEYEAASLSTPPNSGNLGGPDGVRSERPPNGSSSEEAE